MDSHHPRLKVAKTAKTASHAANKSKLEQRLVARAARTAARNSRHAKNIEHRYAGRMDTLRKPSAKAASRARASARSAKYDV